MELTLRGRQRLGEAEIKKRKVREIETGRDKDRYGKKE